MWKRHQEDMKVSEQYFIAYWTSLLTGQPLVYALLVILMLTPELFKLVSLLELFHADETLVRFRFAWHPRQCLNTVNLSC